jgi:hypothetical protein
MVPLTPEELRRRRKALLASGFKPAPPPQPRLGPVNWDGLGTRDRRDSAGAQYGPVVGHLPVEPHMLTEQAWLAIRPLGEKA